MESLSELRKELPGLEKKLGIHFHNPELLVLACTHSSFANENKKTIEHHNERIEFLGDAVLGAIVCEYLYNHFDVAEGSLSMMKARLVDANACLQYVEDLEIESYLLLGKGENITQERGRLKLLATFMEAVIGALFLDQGYPAVSSFIQKKLLPSMQELLEKPPTNFKAKLQEITQNRYKEKPVYLLISEEGPDHGKEFTVEVYLKDVKLGVGKGRSKKIAEQMAAQEAIKKYQEFV